MTLENLEAFCSCGHIESAHDSAGCDGVVRSASGNKPCDCTELDLEDWDDE